MTQFPVGLMDNNALQITTIQFEQLNKFEIKVYQCQQILLSSLVCVSFNEEEYCINSTIYMLSILFAK